MEAKRAKMRPEKAKKATKRRSRGDQEARREAKNANKDGQATSNQKTASVALEKGVHRISTVVEGRTEGHSPVNGSVLTHSPMIAQRAP